MNSSDVTTKIFLNQGFCILPQAVDTETVQRLRASCELAFAETTDSSTPEGDGIDSAVTIYADVGDVLAMRPLISHSSGASIQETKRHRRILHLEFARDQNLPDGFQWHDFVPGVSCKMDRNSFEQ